jgi:hypothetical protein
VSRGKDDGTDLRAAMDHDAESTAAVMKPPLRLPNPIRHVAVDNASPT